MNFRVLRGHIVTLDDEGCLAVSYLGTDPALTTSYNTSLTRREPNYAVSCLLRDDIIEHLLSSPISLSISLFVLT